METNDKIERLIWALKEMGSLLKKINDNILSLAGRVAILEDKQRQSERINEKRH